MNCAKCNGPLIRSELEHPSGLCGDCGGRWLLNGRRIGRLMAPFRLPPPPPDDIITKAVDELLEDQ